MMVIVSPEFEKVAKALAGGNVKCICKAFFTNPRLRQEAVSKVSIMVNRVFLVVQKESTASVTVLLCLIILLEWDHL